jgi:hypothetical protein
MADVNGVLDMNLLNHSAHTNRSYDGAILRFEYDEHAGDRLSRNDETEKGCIFHNVTRQAGIFNSQIGYGLGVNICDINNDSDLDLIVNNINAPAFIFRNNAESCLNNHYLSVVLKGDGLNTRGVGTRVI